MSTDTASDWDPLTIPAEQRVTMIQAAIAALAEVGIKAWPNKDNTRIDTIRRIPCDIGYRAVQLGSMAARVDIPDYESWHARQIANGACGCAVQS